ARTTRLHRPQHSVSAKGFDGLSAVRLTCHSSAHGPCDPPCHPLTSPDAAASTASRPALVTTRDRPSVGQDVLDMQLIWGKRKRKYFRFWGLTRFRKIRSDLPVRQIG